MVNKRYWTRLMAQSDIPRLIEIELSVYPASLYEDADFFINRINLAQAFCWVVENECGIQGYLISYPWIASQPPPLNTVVDKLPDNADCWFIHDCAIMPDYQGQGMAKVLLDQAEQVAIETGLFYSGLISLSSAVDYWQSKGYDLVKLSDKLLIEKILMYGTDACYMIKKLSNLFSD